MASISSLGIGSGLDLNGLLDQLESAEREKLAPITRQQQSYQADISAYGRLESAMSKFQDAASKLNDADFFQSVTTEVSGEAVTATGSQESTPGSYQVDVTQTARAYSIAMTGVADKTAELGAGDISMTLGNGDTLDVSLTAGDSSLEGIRDAINAEEGGVRASIVNDGGASPYRLVLASSETGTESAIDTIDITGDLATGLATDAGTEVTARNAQLTVNGIDIVSQTDQVEEAIQGVTLQIEEVGSSTVEVNRDDAAIEKAVNGFVSAFNSLQGTMDKLTRYDAESGSAGELLGDATLRSVESRLRNTMSESVDGQVGTLSSLGISLTVDGTLEVDEDELGEALASSGGSLAEFFAGTSEEAGKAGQLTSVLDNMLRDGGLISNATEGLETSIESLDQSYARTEENINATIDRYRDQFAQLDGMIASMNSTSNYLNQQFANMSALSSS